VQVVCGSFRECVDPIYSVYWHTLSHADLHIKFSILLTHYRCSGCKGRIHLKCLPGKKPKKKPTKWKCPTCAVRRRGKKCLISLHAALPMLNWLSTSLRKIKGRRTAHHSPRPTNSALSPYIHRLTRIGRLSICTYG
jgi:hypothetical protein